jgi:hypothetical protein
MKKKTMGVVAVLVVAAVMTLVPQRASAQSTKVKQAILDAFTAGHRYYIVCYGEKAEDYVYTVYNVSSVLQSIPSENGLSYLVFQNFLWCRFWDEDDEEYRAFIIEFQSTREAALSEKQINENDGVDTIGPFGNGNASSDNANADRILAAIRAYRANTDVFPKNW